MDLGDTICGFFSPKPCQNIQSLQSGTTKVQPFVWAYDLVVVVGFEIPTISSPQKNLSLETGEARFQLCLQVNGCFEVNLA